MNEKTKTRESVQHKRIIDEPSELIGHFANKEQQNLAGYEGFTNVAEDFVKNLDLVVENSRYDDRREKTYRVKLRSPSSGDPYQYTEDRESPATKEFVMLAEQVIGGKLMDNLSWWDNSGSVSVTHGHAGTTGEEVDVYLVETHLYGAITVDLMSEIPDELIADAQSHISTHQKTLVTAA